MEQTAVHDSPVRIDDIIVLKMNGAAVTCQPSFEINEVDFTTWTTSSKRSSSVDFSGSLTTKNTASENAMRQVARIICASTYPGRRLRTGICRRITGG